MVSLPAMNWTLEQSRQLYRLAAWSEGYIDCNADGHLVIRPQGAGPGPQVDLTEVAAALVDAGLNWPVLVRCHGILRDRVRRLQQAFRRARQQHSYSGEYSAAYPVKVNQQFSVVSDMVNAGSEPVGLEAGSKSELMAVLGLSPPGGLVICNGYKDREYIRIGLIARQLGQRLYLVIEKRSELELVIEQAAALGIRPLLGVRVRLASIGAGNWQNTGGEKSKFGLNAAQVLALVERLRDSGLLDALQLLHFHLGSQLSDLRAIQTGTREAARFYAELQRLGAPLRVLDVGGGLGVDYEGTGSSSFCSMNYAVQDYADAIISTVKEVCQAAAIAEPEIVSECGRAMTAHHAFLLTHVIDVEPGGGSGAGDDSAVDNPQASNRFQALSAAIGSGEPEDLYSKARSAYDELIDSYLAGKLGLPERARAEQSYTRFCARLREALVSECDAHAELLEVLNEKLAAKYFINLSVFQSLPDVWGLDQVFPIVPVSRLDQEPDQRAILYDLTCDSDGHIEYYVDGGGIEKSLPVHPAGDGRDYLLGIFLVGAYQEILGDMHNLFGDTDAVNLEINADGSFRLDQAEHGDRVDELLRLVHFDPNRLRAVYRQRVQAAGLGAQQSRQYLAELEAGLSGYSYLEE